MCFQAGNKETLLLHSPPGRWQAVRHVVPGVIKQHKPEQVTGVILALICFSSVNLMLTFRARGQGKVAASDAGKGNFACLKRTVPQSR